MNDSMGPPPFSFSIRSPLDPRCGSKMYVNITTSVIGMVDVLVSLPCNARVVWLLVTGTAETLNNKLFVLNLSCVELTICLHLFLSFFRNFNLTPPWYESILDFLFAFVLFARPLAQCFICVERYVAVVHPIAFLKYKDLRYKLPAVASLWLITIALGFLCVLLWSFYFFLGAFLPVLAIDTFCSFSILRALKRPSPGDGENVEMNLRKRKAFTIVRIIHVTLFFNYFPMIIVMCLWNVFPSNYSACTIYPIGYYFVLVGNPLHAVFYLCGTKKRPHSRQTSKE